jgi:hypothetical protein
MSRTRNTPTKILLDKLETKSNEKDFFHRFKELSYQESVDNKKAITEIVKNLITEMKEDFDKMKNDAELAKSVLMAVINIQSSELKENPKLSDSALFFFKSQFYFECIRQILKSNSTFIGENRDAILDALETISNCNEYYNAKYPTFCGWNVRLQAEVQDLLISYMSDRAFNKAHELLILECNTNGDKKLSSLARNVAGALADAASCISYQGGMDSIENTIDDHEKLSLLAKVSFYTVKLMDEPSEEDLTKYQELQEKIAKYPNLKKVSGAMLTFTGYIIEALLFIPKVVAIAAGKSNSYSSNSILKKGHVLFSEGRLADKMEDHKKEAENRNRNNNLK